MNTNMLAKSLLTIIIATTLALATVSFVISSHVVQPYQDYAQRQWNGSAHKPDTTDYAQRQSEISVLVRAPLAASDYFMRHPELSASTDNVLAASDYFMRHPELKVSTPASADLTDYFFRQAVIPAASAVDLTDYFFRQR